MYTIYLNYNANNEIILEKVYSNNQSDLLWRKTLQEVLG